MAAIFSSVRSSQRSVGQRPSPRPGAAHHVLGRHDEVDVDVVIGRGDHALVEHLQRVHRRDHDRVRVDETGFGGDRELEVAEAAALAEPRAGRGRPRRSRSRRGRPARARRRRPCARCASRALDRARGARVVGEVARGRAGRTGSSRRDEAPPCRRPCRRRARAGGPAIAASRGSTSPSRPPPIPASPRGGGPPPPRPRSSGCGSPASGSGRRRAGRDRPTRARASRPSPRAARRRHPRRGRDARGYAGPASNGSDSYRRVKPPSANTPDGGVDGEARARAQELFEHDPPLQSRRRGTEAVVGAHAERQEAVDLRATSSSSASAPNSRSSRLAEP